MRAIKTKNQDAPLVGASFFCYKIKYMKLRKRPIIIAGISLAVAGLLAYSFYPAISDFFFLLPYQKNVEFKNVESALKEDREMIRKNPQHDGAYYSLGQGLYSLKGYDDAIDAFISATEIDPKKVYYWSFLAKAYQAKKDYLGARDMFTKVLDMEPDKPVNYTNLAWLYYFRIDEEQKKAFDILKKGLTRFPEDRAMLFDITRYYLYDNNWEEFLKYAPRYLAIDPDYPAIRDKYKELTK